MLVSIVNLSDEEKTIAPLHLDKLKFETFIDDRVAKVNVEKTTNKIIKDANRIITLKEALRTSHLNKEEVENIESICVEFEDIFHL